LRHRVHRFCDVGIGICLIFR